MALCVLFENKNILLFLYFICLLLNLQMCQIILSDPIYIYIYMYKEKLITKVIQVEGEIYWGAKSTL